MLENCRIHENTKDNSTAHPHPQSQPARKSEVRGRNRAKCRRLLIIAKVVTANLDHAHPRLSDKRHDAELIDPTVNYIMRYPRVSSNITVRGLGLGVPRT
jgi:hypothetical protein